ncbi:MAG: preprotein translocase subunit SecG [Planctomycetota bacterium]
MIIFPMAEINLIMHIIAVLFVLVALALILLILMQRGKGGGLSGAFGGLGASSLLGTKTGDFLTWVTIGLTAAFLILAVLMGLFYRPGVSEPSGPVFPAPAATQTQPDMPESPFADE